MLPNIDNRIDLLTLRSERMAELKVSPAADDTKAAEGAAARSRVQDSNARNDGQRDPTLHRLATREPTSFHQATIYNGLVRHGPAWRKYGLLAASIGIVFLQCFVAGGIFWGCFRSCNEQSDCGRGMFYRRETDWCEAVHNCEDFRYPCKG